MTRGGHLIISKIQYKNMFVKMYSYKIKQSDFQKWKKINNAAKKIYTKYGGGNSKVLIKKGGNFIKIIELDFYKFKKDFLKITTQVDQNKKINKLYQEFLAIVYQKKITQEDFETF